MSTMIFYMVTILKSTRLCWRFCSEKKKEKGETEREVWGLCKVVKDVLGKKIEKVIVS